jgi:heme/copper-type cytochrome/quinol oxidase subunit 1
MYHEGWAKTSFWLTFVGTSLTFFPMHIAGLLGMTRRVYTYEPGLGWDAYNLVETIGAFVLAAGLLVIAANLLGSRLRGAPAGADPFFGGTLEWTIPSPPPAYNFAVIPTVTSPYPNWDRPEPDRGRLVLEEGHETPASTVRDARLEEILEMPSESPWPIVLALFAAVAFVMLLAGHGVVAALFFGLGALTLGAWHLQEPEE